MRAASIETLKENISIYDLFDRCTPPVEYETDEIECQIACPFHGADVNKSARVYPPKDDDGGNSMYCWTCAKSWDIIDFWAEINQWWTGDGPLQRLDVGRAISDLSIRFNLRDQKPDWKKSLEKSLKHLKVQRLGYDEAPIDERESVKTYFASRLVSSVSSIPVSARQDAWEDVRQAWDSLDSIDLHSSGWWGKLSSWFSSDVCMSIREGVTNEGSSSIQEHD